MDLAPGLMNFKNLRSEGGPARALDRNFGGWAARSLGFSPFRIIVGSGGSPPQHRGSCSSFASRRSSSSRSRRCSRTLPPLGGVEQARLRARCAPALSRSSRPLVCVSTPR
jgi:hypothetical protein